MKEQVIDAALHAYDGFPPDFWKRLRERIIPAIVTAESDEEALERIEYHITQVKAIYAEGL